MKYIYQHLGLGDHIICNGLIRELQKLYGDITLFVKPIYLQTVKAMYADNSRINLVARWDAQVPYFIQEHEIKSEDYIKIGHEFLKQDISFDRSFYEQMGIDFEKRWSSFFVPRNKERENALYSRLVLDKDYLFIHAAPELGHGLKNIPTNYFKIIPHKNITDNIIDYCKIIENAKEIHCYQSSFSHLVDSIPTTGKLFLHMYTKRHNLHPIIEIATYKKEKNWEVIG